jgi:anionic cell wall polymer biosynthesis LytR-Cps2A-Psr (LCP) family protein
MKRTANYKVDPSIFLILAMALIIGGGILFSINILRTDPIDEALKGEDVLNILFVFEGGGTPLSTYVMMYSPINNRASVISIPGETGRILKTADRVDRLDSVYHSGNTNAYKTEIEELLGLPIAYSVVFEAEKLSKTIDAIGGVEIFIPYPIEVYEPEPILFPSGASRLDGDKGTQYILFELPEEDRNDVSLRRERFFLGLLKSLGEKSSSLKNPSIARYFYPLLKTSMNQLARRRLFEALYALDIDRISVQPVAGTFREVSGQQLLMPYYDGTVIKDVVRQAQRSLAQKTQGMLMERVFTVEILNGTTVAGLASRTAELIRSFNYDVIAIRNAEKNDYASTEVVDRTGLEDVAASFAAVIQCTKIKSEPRLPEDELDTGSASRSTEYRADFTLIIGKDFNGRVVTGN